jgi:hypothetical protein
MALSQHVKRLAMDAVAGKETTDWIRKHNSDAVTDSLFDPQEEGLSERVKERAADAVWDIEPLRQVRLVSVNKIDKPLPTPTREGRLASQKITLMYQWGSSINAVHHEATKDTFGRDDDGR